MLPKAHLTSHSRMSGSRFLPQRELNECGSGLLSEDIEWLLWLVSFGGITRFSSSSPFFCRKWSVFLGWELSWVPKSHLAACSLWRCNSSPLDLSPSSVSSVIMAILCHTRSSSFLSLVFFFFFQNEIGMKASSWKPAQTTRFYTLCKAFPISQVRNHFALCFSYNTLYFHIATETGSFMLVTHSTSTYVKLQSLELFLIHSSVVLPQHWM